MALLDAELSPIAPSSNFETALSFLRACELDFATASRAFAEASADGAVAENERFRLWLERAHRNLPRAETRFLEFT